MRTTLFEYMIGNTDVSVSGLHNIVLVRDSTTLALNTVAYDFDFSGLVNTRYSSVDPRLRVKRVTEPLHRRPGKTPAGRLLTFANREGQAAVPARDASLPPIGRLDEDSRGLLLLSSDGVVAKAVIGPDSDLDKEYLVVVEGAVTETRLSRLRHGLELDGRRLKPARVTQIEPQRLRFILKEGRNRQIRRMRELVELRVVDLQRIRIGPLRLGDLPEGRWRALSEDERAALIEGSRPQKR